MRVVKLDDVIYGHGFKKQLSATPFIYTFNYFDVNESSIKILTGVKVTVSKEKSNTKLNVQPRFQIELLLSCRYQNCSNKEPIDTLETLSHTQQYLR